MVSVHHRLNTELTYLFLTVGWGYSLSPMFFPLSTWEERWNLVGKAVDFQQLNPVVPIRVQNEHAIILFAFAFTTVLVPKWLEMYRIHLKGWWNAVDRCATGLWSLFTVVSLWTNLLIISINLCYWWFTRWTVWISFWELSRISIKVVMPWERRAVLWIECERLANHMPLQS